MSEAPRYRKILCPVDFSEPSRVAFEAALDLAEHFEASVTLIHVVQLPIAVPDGLLDPSYVNAVMRDAEKSLAEWKTEAEGRRKVPIETVLAPGGSWDRIVTQAREGGHDLIVIGTHGRTGIKHVLLGSMAERVVQHAACPVLVARRKA